MQNQICLQCQTSFEITEADLAFYAKIDVPLPKLCPKDRLQRRLAWRNERTLFRRKSSKSGETIISNMRPDSPIPVYHVDEWHKDDWEPPQLESFDFNRSFFDQFKELAWKSPHMHKASGGQEHNSEYTNHSGYCKNCYYIFNSEYAEDCMYLRFSEKCKDCFDSTNILKSELCYECVNVEGCYNLKFSDDCKNCSDSWFLRNCRGMKNSIFCYDLQQKEYCLFNEQLTKETYAEKLAELKLHTYSGIQAAIKKWGEWSAQFHPIREILQNCESCSGNSLYNCKNAKDCYSGSGLEDCRYVLNSVNVKDGYDMYAYGEVELGYEYVTAFKSYNVKFSCYVINASNVEYSESCWNIRDCFGCVGLKGKSFCIFNKQYPEEEYKELVPRIKEKMRQDGDYGEFFPSEISPYPYEDTVANDYFPQSDRPTKAPEGDSKETNSLPDDINDANLGQIAQNSYRCPETQKLFRFQAKELEFYKRMQLPLPRISFEARYKNRNKLVPFPY